MVFSGVDLAAGNRVGGQQLVSLVADDFFNRAIDGGVIQTTDTNQVHDVEVLGDINGDGLDDVLISVHYQTNVPILGQPGPSYGRMDLLMGRSDAQWQAYFNSAMLNDEYLLGADGFADAVLADFALASGELFAPDNVFALGDINADGFGDFAVARTREDDGLAEAALFVFLGSNAFAPLDPSDPSDVTDQFDPLTDADIVIRQELPGGLGSGVSIYSDFSISAGDYDGDGEGDLAIGRSFTARADSIEDDPPPNLLFNVQDRGEVFVFFSIADRGSDLLLSDADVVLAGETAGDRLGILATPAAIDVNHDRVDDLIVGARLADGFVGQVKTFAGKVYFIPGQPRPGPLPTSDVTPISNTGVAGSGSFLVDLFTGQPEVRSGQLTSTDTEQWFRFTTLGDGQPGDRIEVSPAAEDQQTTLLSTIDGHLLGNTPVTAGTTEISVVSGASTGIIEVDLSGFLAHLDDPSHFNQIALRLDVSSLTASPTDEFFVSLLDKEGDSAITTDDLLTSVAADFTLDTSSLPGVLEMDVRDEVLAAMAGRTRLTFRIEATGGGEMEVTRGFAGGDTGLAVTTARQEGVAADLFDANGSRLASSQSLIDLQATTAGTYFVRVFSPLAGLVLPQDFSIALTVPAAGEHHPTTDRDTLRGGEGDDLLAGNRELDRHFGGGGDDQFVAEEIEVLDESASELPLIAPPGDQEIAFTPHLPIDAEADILDPFL